MGRRAGNIAAGWEGGGVRGVGVGGRWESEEGGAGRGGCMPYPTIRRDRTLLVCLSVCGYVLSACPLWAPFVSVFFLLFFAPTEIDHIRVGFQKGFPEEVSVSFSSNASV